MMQAHAVLTQAIQTQAKQQSKQKVNPAWFLLPLLGVGLMVGELAYVIGTDAVTDWHQAPALSAPDAD